LRAYAKEIRLLLGAIENVSQKSLNAYKYIIGCIKNASNDVVASRIMIMADYLENAALEDDLEYIKTHNPVFIASTKHFLTKLDTMLL